MQSPDNFEQLASLRKAYISRSNYGDIHEMWIIKLIFE
jgi:hypothetical protein